jgi:hypothetical protein
LAGPDDEEPADYVCPITHELMSDPVVTADGQSYERYAIEQWLRHSTLSPLTNEPLVHLNLTPNMALRRLIREWIATRDAAKPEGATPKEHHGRRGRRGGGGGGGGGGGQQPPRSGGQPPPPGNNRSGRASTGARSGGGGRVR